MCPQLMRDFLHPDQASRSSVQIQEKPPAGGSAASLVDDGSEVDALPDLCSWSDPEVASCVSEEFLALFSPPWTCFWGVGGCF